MIRALNLFLLIAGLGLCAGDVTSEQAAQFDEMLQRNQAQQSGNKKRWLDAVTYVVTSASYGSCTNTPYLVAGTAGNYCYQTTDTDGTENGSAYFEVVNDQVTYMKFPTADCTGDPSSSNVKTIALDTCQYNELANSYYIISVSTSITPWTSAPAGLVEMFYDSAEDCVNSSSYPSLFKSFTFNQCIPQSVSDGHLANRPATFQTCTSDSYTYSTFSDTACASSTIVASTQQYIHANCGSSNIVRSNNIYGYSSFLCQA